MQTPQIRPGKVDSEHTRPMPKVVAFFYDSAQGNSAIQQLMGLGIPSDRLGVTPPETIEGEHGMVLSIACPDEAMIPRVEAICRVQGAEIHRSKC